MSNYNTVPLVYSPQHQLPTSLPTSSLKSRRSRSRSSSRSATPSSPHHSSVTPTRTMPVAVPPNTASQSKNVNLTAARQRNVVALKTNGFMNGHANGKGYPGVNGVHPEQISEIDEGDNADDEQDITKSPRRLPSKVEKPVDWEIPRKTLHSSIGFLVLRLFSSQQDIQPVVYTLGGMLTVIVSADALRLNFAPFERLYERVLGFLMRDSEKRQVNGVVWYLIGVIFVLSFYPRDIAVVSILILSWADTAASTIGRLWGRYTPSLPSSVALLPFLPRPFQLRIHFSPRKSVAGFVAAFCSGALIAGGFWGWFSKFGETATDHASWLWDENRTIGGWLGLGALSLVAGITASVAEALDLGSLDDNLTLPIISGGVLAIFTKVMSLLP